MKEKTPEEEMLELLQGELMQDLFKKETIVEDAIGIVSKYCLGQAETANEKLLVNNVLAELRKLQASYNELVTKH